MTQLVLAAGLSPALAPPASVLEVELYGTALVFEEFGRVIAPGDSAIVMSSTGRSLSPEQTHESCFTKTDPGDLAAADAAHRVKYGRYRSIVDDLLEPGPEPRPWG